MQHAAMTHAPHYVLHPTLKALLPHPVSSPHKPPQASAKTAPGHPIHLYEAPGSSFPTTQGKPLGNIAKPASKCSLTHYRPTSTTKPRAIPWAILYSDKDCHPARRLLSGEIHGEALPLQDRFTGEANAQLLEYLMVNIAQHHGAMHLATTQLGQLLQRAPAVVIVLREHRERHKHLVGV